MNAKFWKWNANSNDMISLGNSKQPLNFYDKGLFPALTSCPLWVGRREEGGWRFSFTLFSLRDPGW